MKHELSGHGLWTKELANTGRVEFHTSRRHLVLYSLLCLTFVAISIWAIFNPAEDGDGLIGLLCALFFGAGLVAFVTRLLRRDPSVVIDAQGVRVTTRARQFRGARSWTPGFPSSTRCRTR